MSPLKAQVGGDQKWSEKTYIHQMARNTTPNDDVWQLDVYIKIYWQYNTVFYGCDWTVEH